MSTGHEKSDPEVSKIYPDGIHGRLAEHLGEQGFTVRTATLDEPEHGLTYEILNQTDVLIWWGHQAHDEVSDEIVDRVQLRVLDGMGLIVLHSAHFSKIFKRLMGATCNLKWRDVGEREKSMGNGSRDIPLRPGWGSILRSPRRKCTASVLISPRPERWSLPVGLRGARYFAAAAVSGGGEAGSSIFGPGTKHFQFITSPKCFGSSPMPSAGPRRWPARRSNSDRRRGLLSSIG